MELSSFLILFYLLFDESDRGLTRYRPPHPPTPPQLSFSWSSQKPTLGRKEDITGIRFPCIVVYTFRKREEMESSLISFM